MSTVDVQSTPEAAAPRVRDQARDVAALMGFSAVASGTLALILVMLTALAR